MKEKDMTINIYETLKKTPNPEHIQNRLRGSRIYRNRKKYTRKVIHNGIDF